MPTDAPFALPTEPFVVPSPDEHRMARLARQIADDAVTADIETGGVRVELDGRVWRDIRPMVDPREHCPAVIDMATLAIQYAVGTGLMAVHPQRPYLLTPARRG